MTDRLKSLRHDDRGASLAEYAVMAALIAIAAIAALVEMGAGVGALLDRVALLITA